MTKKQQLKAEIMHGLHYLKGTDSLNTGFNAVAVSPSCSKWDQIHSVDMFKHVDSNCRSCKTERKLKYPIKIKKIP